MTIYKAP